MSYRIASWNVNSLRARLDHVLAWLDTHQPDLLALQETKVTDELFPIADFEAIGYQATYSGQKSYNGVAILSKTTPLDIVREFPNFDDPMRRVLAASYGELRLLNVYVPNGASLDSDKYQYKLTWLQHLQQFLQQELQRYPKYIIVGDFNIAPEDCDVHDPRAWEGSVLVSDAERCALKKLMGLGLTDCYRQFPQAEASYSWWDYRAASFRRNNGLRIDLMLASQDLTQVCTASHIDREPRAWEKPSDHAPVFADFSHP